MMDEKTEAKKSTQDSEYASLRAKRRARSKATIIGRFADAKEYLDEGKTISGLTDTLDAFGTYRDAFEVVLAKYGLSSADDYSRLFSHTNGYQNFYEILCREYEVLEVATFMLILYDRLTAVVNASGSAAEVFHMTVQLEACYRSIYIDTPQDRARDAAVAKHKVDPRQADKAIVRECWNTWQKNPDDYKSKAAFARDMLKQFPNLESQPVIEGWCRTWERES
jgi:hypothetical protein